MLSLLHHDVALTNPYKRLSQNSITSYQSLNTLGKRYKWCIGMLMNPTKCVSFLINTPDGTWLKNISLEFIGTSAYVNSNSTLIDFTVCDLDSIVNGRLGKVL